MSVSTEHERKYKITGENLAGLMALLGEPEEELTQVDRYYDSEHAELFCAGIFMRIRNKRFQLKFNLDDVKSQTSSGHTVCTEVDLPLIFTPNDGEVLSNVLRSLGIQFPPVMESPFDLFDYASWEESVIIEKKRSIFRLDNYIVSIDDVKSLGSYIELESASTIVEHSEREARLLAFIDDKNFDYIDTGYNALYWRQSDKTVYFRSPYVMSRDKNA